MAQCDVGKKQIIPGDYLAVIYFSLFGCSTPIGHGGKNKCMPTVQPPVFCDTLMSNAGFPRCWIPGEVFFTFTEFQLPSDPHSLTVIGGMRPLVVRVSFNCSCLNVGATRWWWWWGGASLIRFELRRKEKNKKANKTQTNTNRFMNYVELVWRINGV